MQSGIKPLGRERLWLLLLLAPTLLGLLFGAVGSVAASAAISLLDWDLLTPPTWAGLQNYLALPSDRLFLESLRITTQFAAMYVPGVIILSLIVALLLKPQNSRRQFFFGCCSFCRSSRRRSPSGSCGRGFTRRTTGS